MFTYLHKYNNYTKSNMFPVNVFKNVGDKNEK